MSTATRAHARPPTRPTPEESPGWVTLLRQHRVVQVGAGLVLVHLVFRAWATFGAWYHYDDYAFISRMLNDGLAPSVALRDYAGHLMPAAMYLSWLFNEIAPLQWWPAAAFLVLLQAAAAVGLLRMLLVMFGPRRGVLAPLALYLFTVFSVPISIWWAAGANQLPLQVALFWGLTAHVQHLRTRRVRHLVAAVAWPVAGLLFYEKTILVLAAYALVTLCWFAAGGLGSRLRTVVTTWPTAVASYVVLGLVYLGVYVSIGLNFAPSRAAEFPIGGVAGNIVLRGYVTGVLGGPLRWAYVDDPGAIAAPSDLVVLVCLVVLGLFVREVARTRTRSLRALTIPGFFLAANVLLVLAGRASFVGPLIALDYRYQGESGAVTALALACATMPILGAVDGVGPRRHSELLDAPRRAAAAVAVVCALGLFSSTLYVRHWQASQTPQRYTAALLGDLAKADGVVAMVDGTVPKQVLWGAAYPLDTHRYLLRQFRDEARFGPTSTDRLSIVAPDGHVVPAAVPPVRRAARGTDGSTCAYRIGSAGATVQLDGPLAYGGWWVRIGYLASAGSPVEVTAGGVTRRTTVLPGLHSLYVQAGPGAFTSVRVDGLAGQVTLCTDDVTVGRPEPLQESS